MNNPLKQNKEPGTLGDATTDKRINTSACKLNVINKGNEGGVFEEH